MICYQIFKSPFFKNITKYRYRHAYMHFINLYVKVYATSYFVYFNFNNLTKQIYTLRRIIVNNHQKKHAN